MKGLSRATDTALVTTGSEILQRLEQLGPNELLDLKIDELYALIVNADPLGSIPKPNKKTRQEKANLLPIVQAATIGRFLAVAAVSAPSLLPILVAPVLYEGKNILVNLKGQPEIFLPISDPVISYYVTDA